VEKIAITPKIFFLGQIFLTHPKIFDFSRKSQQTVLGKFFSVGVSLVTVLLLASLRIIN